VLFDLLHGRLKRSPARLVTGTEIIDVVREHGRACASTGTSGGTARSISSVVADGAHSACAAADAERYQRSIRGAASGRRCRTAPALAQPACCATRARHAADDGSAAGRRRPADDLLEPADGGAGARRMPLDLGVLQRTPRRCGRRRRHRLPSGANDFSRATYRNVALPRWNDGPILFIGDAAHGTSRNSGRAPISAWSMRGRWRDAVQAPARCAGHRLVSPSSARRWCASIARPAIC
jgi:2-polyprenyl-6-methoxyphenol hydroxylase-like FAD-dependent oxidoreductase